MPAPPAVQLAVATPWSFHHGAAGVEELARAAAARGIGALGLADRNGLWGAVYFQKACQTAGVRPLFGMRMEVEGARAQLLARDAAGWAALCRLTTRFHLEEVAREAPGVGRSVRLLNWLNEERARAPGSLVVLARDAELLRALGGDRAGRISTLRRARAPRQRRTPISPARSASRPPPRRPSLSPTAPSTSATACWRRSAPTRTFRAWTRRAIRRRSSASRRRMPGCAMRFR